MDKYLLAALTVFLLCAAPARADDADATFAMLDFFKKACFANSEDLNKAREFFDASYKRVEGEQKQKLLDYISAAEGDVWDVKLPEGDFTAMLEPKGRCHLLAQKADDNMLHKKMIAFAIDTQNNVAPKVVSRYERAQQGELDMSGFRVREADGKDVYIVMASTMPGAAVKKEPAGILTLERAPKPNAAH